MWCVAVVWVVWREEVDKGDGSYLCAGTFVVYTHISVFRTLRPIHPPTLQSALGCRHTRFSSANCSSALSEWKLEMNEINLSC